jgi:cytochrome bd-type quinol oxidase subunit 1
MAEYPIFNVPLAGGSLLIAAVAIFHVFISHFSVGAGFFMAIAERKANAENDQVTIGFLKKYSYMVLLVPYVLGTVSGVGVWFTIALVNPRAVSILIHQFVFDWAIEWVLFIIEGTAIFIYAFRWNKMSPKAHNRIGWIFAIASLLTLIIINAILSFMLTPGSWQPFDAGLMNYKGLFNPTYLPMTLGRILISLALAGTGSIVLLSFLRKTETQTRAKMVRLAYIFILPIIFCLPLGSWVFSMLSEQSQNFLRGGASTMTIFLGLGTISLIILFVAALVSTVNKDFSTSILGGVLLCLLAFVAFGAMEFVREGVRKPYIIDGFMYSTGVTKPEFAHIDPRANQSQTQQTGIISASPWALPPDKAVEQLNTIDYGKAVFTAACSKCHNVDGYNAIRPLTKGWSQKTILNTLGHLDEIKPSMPPFPGTNDEKMALTEYLLSLHQ